MSDEELEIMFEELCESKAEEFRLLGYDQVTAEDIWACVSEKYKKKGPPQLHQIVSDILSLRTTKFMNYLTMSAYKGNPF
jgi:hypothetical protein